MFAAKFFHEAESLIVTPLVIGHCRKREYFVFLLGSIMGEGFMGGVHPLFRTFFDFDLVLQDTKSFSPVLNQKYLRRL